MLSERGDLYLDNAWVSMFIPWKEGETEEEAKEREQKSLIFQTIARVDDTDKIVALVVPGDPGEDYLLGARVKTGEAIEIEGNTVFFPD